MRHLATRLFALMLTLFLGAPALAATVDAPEASRETRLELQGTITGRVTEARTGRPLRSVQVFVDGTNLGSLTNADGRYQIMNVPAGQVTVRAQIIGFRTGQATVTVTSGASVAADFEMEEQALALDEVIVTGTAGQARRREIGNTIAQIGARELEEMPIRDLGDVLQARIAGGVISDATGQVGAGRTIRLRGVNSLTMANNPLIYVDGVRINSDPFNAAPGVNNAASPLSSLNPHDIERVEVIKGAAASTLYGTEASSGVIQIFTKRGARGQPEWSLDVSQGINNMGHVGPSEDPTGLWFNDCSMFQGCPARGSWLRNGHIQNYNLSVQGGGEALSYFLSGKWGNEEGVLDLQHQNDWALRGNFGFSASPTLNVQFTSGYTNRGVRWLEEGNNAQSLVINIIRGPAGLSPNTDHSYHFDRQVWTHVDHLTSGINLLWTPTGRLTHRVNAGLDLASAESSRERPWGDPLFPSGDREVNTQARRRLSLDYAGTLTHGFSPDLSSSTSWGSQLYERFDKGVVGYGRDFAGPGRKVVGSGAVTTSSENHIRMVSGGLFLEQMLGWRDRLFVTGGVRWDGFSTFGEGLGMVAYPKLSAAYTLSDHAFWPAAIESFKLRAAMGESGRAPGAFDAVRVWSSISGDAGRPGVTPSNPGNPTLGPERTREFEYGFEGTAFENFLVFEFTGFNQRTYDALIAVNQIPSLGYPGTQLENVGELRAWGTEAMVSLRPIRTPSVDWEVGGRYAYTMTRAEDLGGLQQIAAFVPLWQQWIMPGHPIPVYYGPVVQNPDEVGVRPVYENEVLGGAFPPHTAGFNTSLTLAQRLTFSGLGEFQGGHYLTNGTATQQTRRGLWPECMGIRERVIAGDIVGLTARQQDRCQNQPPYIAWTERADFFKLRQVSVSYRLPQRFLWAGARGASVRLEGNNLLTITNYTGLDPEAIQGGSLEGTSGLYRVEYYQLPPARRFLFSMNLNF
jgi:TonB-dependent starch-binding outer membrane protein SusC